MGAYYNHFSDNANGVDHSRNNSISEMLSEPVDNQSPPPQVHVETPANTISAADPVDTNAGIIALKEKIQCFIAKHEQLLDKYNTLKTDHASLSEENRRLKLKNDTYQSGTEDCSTLLQQVHDSGRS